ncbi:unnamed protein product [Brassica rapa subsp. trilocularis]
METRGVDVEKRRSHRIIIFPLLFFTIINGEPLDMHFISPSLLDGSMLHGDLISSPVLHRLIVIGRHDFVSSSPSFHFEKLPSSLAILRVVSVEQSPLSLTSSNECLKRLKSQETWRATSIGCLGEFNKMSLH